MIITDGGEEAKRDIFSTISGSGDSNLKRDNASLGGGEDSKLKRDYYIDPKAETIETVTPAVAADTSKGMHSIVSKGPLGCANND